MWVCIHMLTVIEVVLPCTGLSSGMKAFPKCGGARSIEVRAVASSEKGSTVPLEALLYERKSGSVQFGISVNRYGSHKVVFVFKVQGEVKGRDNCAVSFVWYIDSV